MRSFEEITALGCGYKHPERPTRFGAFPALPGPAWRPTEREILMQDALDKAWVLAELVGAAFGQPPVEIRNATEALQDALRALREVSLPACAGDQPGGGT